MPESKGVSLPERLRQAVSDWKDVGAVLSLLTMLLGWAGLRLEGFRFIELLPRSSRGAILLAASVFILVVWAVRERLILHRKRRGEKVKVSLHSVTVAYGHLLGLIDFISEMYLTRRVENPEAVMRMLNVALSEYMNAAKSITLDDPLACDFQRRHIAFAQRFAGLLSSPRPALAGDKLRRLAFEVVSMIRSYDVSFEADEYRNLSDADLQSLVAQQGEPASGSG